MGPVANYDILAGKAEKFNILAPRAEIELYWYTVAYGTQGPTITAT